MLTREELSAMIEEYIHSITFPETPSKLYDPIAYALEEGSKRLRPLLLMVACNAYSEDVKQALPCAAAVEVYHNSTLLHDDIMDNAEVRRGKTSVYKKWGKNVAILSGDAMVLYSYHLLRKQDPDMLPSLLAEFNKMSLEVCEGQQYDMDFESREDVTLEEYGDMIRLKTAVIFAAAAKMGGMIGGAGSADRDTLYEIGLEIGTAFQIQDDYLDTYGTPEVLGKAVGGDIAESKKTFLIINALNEAGGATRRALLATFRDDKLPLVQKISRIKTIYDSLDIPDMTLGIINSRLNKALSLLDSLSIESNKTSVFRQLIQSLVNRNK